MFVDSMNCEKSKKMADSKRHVSSLQRCKLATNRKSTIKVRFECICTCMMRSALHLDYGVCQIGKLSSLILCGTYLLGTSILIHLASDTIRILYYQSDMVRSYFKTLKSFSFLHRTPLLSDIFAPLQRLLVYKAIILTRTLYIDIQLNVKISDCK